MRMDVRCGGHGISEPVTSTADAYKLCCKGQAALMALNVESPPSSASRMVIERSIAMVVKALTAMSLLRAWDAMPPWRIIEHIPRWLRPYADRGSSLLPLRGDSRQGRAVAGTMTRRDLRLASEDMPAREYVSCRVRIEQVSPPSTHSMHFDTPNLPIESCCRVDYLPKRDRVSVVAGGFGMRGFKAVRCDRQDIRSPTMARKLSQSMTGNAQTSSRVGGMASAMPPSCKNTSSIGCIGSLWRHAVKAMNAHRPYPSS